MGWNSRCGADMHGSEPLCLFTVTDNVNNLLPIVSLILVSIE